MADKTQNHRITHPGISSGWIHGFGGCHDVDGRPNGQKTQLWKPGIRIQLWSPGTDSGTVAPFKYSFVGAQANRERRMDATGYGDRAKTDKPEIRSW
jgi:hypothetical protein